MNYSERFARLDCFDQTWNLEAMSFLEYLQRDEIIASMNLLPFATRFASMKRGPIVRVHTYVSRRILSHDTTRQQMIHAFYRATILKRVRCSSTTITDRGTRTEGSNTFIVPLYLWHLTRKWICSSHSRQTTDYVVVKRVSTMT